MKRLFKRSNIFLVLLILINVLPASQIRLFLVVFVIVESFVNMYFINKKKVPPFIKGLNAIVALFTIYGVFLVISNPAIYGVFGDRVSNTSYLTTIYISLLPIYSFYRYTMIGDLNEKTIRSWALILVGITTFSYFQREAHLIQIIHENNINSEDVTNNVGYIFLSVLPLLFLFKDKQIIEYGLLLYCTAFMMMSMKRGAMIIALLGILIILKGSRKAVSRSVINVKSIFLTIVIFGFIYYVYVNYLGTNDYFLNKIDDGGGSGRTDTYYILLNTFANRFDFLSMLFGEGANSTIKIAGNYAHNDWLEILINQGLLGIVIYLFYWRCFFTEVSLNKKNMDIFYPLCLLFVMTLLKTFFSMSYSGMSYIDCLSFGFFVAKSNYKRIHKASC